MPHPWTRPTYDAKRHPDPIRRFERDYVTFGSLLSQFRLSFVCRLSVCLSSVTLVPPTRRVEAFGKISSPLCTLAIL